MSARFVGRSTLIRTLSHALGRSALLGLASLAGPLFAIPQASAQYAYFDSRDIFDDADMLLSPRAVAGRLQNRGFHELTRPRFDGTAYVIDATNPAGNRVRLFVDARSGVLLGRRPLDTAYYPSARPPHARAGYGWTEDDTAPRRQARLQGGLVPPADIPDIVPPPNPSAAETNPLGVNPDGKARPAKSAPKKSAKLTQPAKPSVARTAPPAPAPKIEASEPTKTEAAKPEPTQSPATATVDPAQTVTPAASEPVLPTPAANQEPAAGKDTSEPAKAEAPKADPAPAGEAKEPTKEAKKDEGWQDPPAQDEKRKVRVIGGTTVVPGGSNETQPAN